MPAHLKQYDSAVVPAMPLRRAPQVKRPLAYFNEIDLFCADWLRSLMLEGEIAPGIVDTRSIEDVTPDDLAGFTQCHFFAGIGAWSRALRLAGWPDGKPVWTGSAPCQPFSQAGKGGGFADERHLWPAWHHLIRERRPGVVFGEQVASSDGLAWFDLVQTDMEGEGYAVGPKDLCAAGFGAPHIRQRLYFVAHHHHPGCVEHAQRNGESLTGGEEGPSGHDAGGRGELGDASSRGGWDTGEISRTESSLERGVRCLVDVLESAGAARDVAEHERDGRRKGRGTVEERAGLGDDSELGHRHYKGLSVGSWSDDGGRIVRLQGSAFGEAEPVRGFWSRADWIYCRDGKYRAVEPGTFPLAHRAPARVGRLRAYGNAIVAPLAAEFIRAYMGVTV